MPARAYCACSYTVGDDATVADLVDEEDASNKTRKRGIQATFRQRQKVCHCCHLADASTLRYLFYGLIASCSVASQASRPAWVSLKTRGAT